MKRDTSELDNKPGQQKESIDPTLGGSHKSYNERSPQEAHDQMKEVVSKAIATAAGAIEGVADTMKENHLPEKAREAVESLGETTRQVGKASKDEIQRTRSEISEEQGSPSSTQEPQPSVGGGAADLGGTMGPSSASGRHGESQDAEAEQRDRRTLGQGPS